MGFEWLKILELLPFIRKLVRLRLERNMEVTVKGHSEDMGEPYSIVAPDPARGILGAVYALLDLKLINNRTDRSERIIGCWAELRCRRLLFWKRTLTRIPVLTPSTYSWDLDYPIENIYLEPMSEPQTYTINIIGDFEVTKMPRRSELVLVLQMVGPIKKYIYKLTNVLHNPKQYADKASPSL